MSKRFIVVLVVLVLILVVGSVFITKSLVDGSSDNTPKITLTLPQAIVQDMLVQYGKDIKIVQGPTEVKSIYMTYWTDATRLHGTLWIDGQNIEVVSAPLPTPTPTPNGG